MSPVVLSRPFVSRWRGCIVVNMASPAWCVQAVALFVLVTASWQAEESCQSFGGGLVYPQETRYAADHSLHHSKALSKLLTWLPACPNLVLRLYCPILQYERLDKNNSCNDPWQYDMHFVCCKQLQLSLLISAPYTPSADSQCRILWGHGSLNIAISLPITL